MICTISGMNNQKKRIGCLCALLVVGGGWIAFASRHAGGAEGQGTKNGGQRTENSGQTAAPSFFLSDPNLVSGAGANLGRGELFLKMMLSVGLVLGLGVAALYLSKKVLPKVTQAPGKEIHVLETAYLGPRKTLHLVEVGGRRLLIAGTNDRVTMLTNVSDAWLDMSQRQLDDPVKA
jgi:flagellar biogenesis protein FliO